MKSLLLFLSASLLLDAQILVHGHRGARTSMPENTLPGFEFAIQQGVNVLEMDMAVTKDNVIVLSHDSALDKKICTGPEGMSNVIRQLTLSEVKQWDCGSKVNPEFPKQKAIPGTRVPTLDEAFAATKNAPIEYNIETKISPKRPELAPTPEEFVRLFLDVVRKHKLESRVILQSFDPRTLVAMSKVEPKIRLSMLTPTSAMDVLKNWVESCKEAGNAKIISPHYRTVTKARVEEAHQAGLQVVSWTANDPEQWQSLVDNKVDAIITDDPKGLISWLKEKKLTKK